jgi:hypothetical protein
MLAVEKEAIHRISGINDSREPLDPVVSREDRSILRELGHEIAEIGSLPVQEEKKRQWTRLNKLEPVKPMIWLNDICWHELDVDGELRLRTSSPFCRRIESGLRQTIYWWKHMRGDLVVDPFVCSPLAIEHSGIGIEVEEEISQTDETNDVVSHHYHATIRDPEDINKISSPCITHDTAKSELDFQVYEDIFDGVPPVRKRGTPGFSFSPWDDIVRFTDAQEVLMNLAMKPDFIHELVDRLVTVYLEALDQYESLGLLALNNTNVRIGSGAYGYTDELPRRDFDGEHVRTVDIWGSATAQIFSEVSPSMHEEFALSYERRWLQRFGLTYYGCCEPLHHKIDILRTIPNLRKVSVSPWNDIEQAAERIAKDYVFSYKPSPAVLARDIWNPELAGTELEEVLKTTGKYDCSVEIIMKDISTVRYQPQRLWDWVEIAGKVVENFS